MAILPYYIANLNIEYTYQQRTGRYLEFPNLCFVDTLDNLDWEGASGGAVTRQGSFNLGGLSEENWIRIQEQNEKPISVIIGNPPYNATQSYWNDFNPNRPYPDIDQRIRETYANASTARNLHKQYDMYKRFIRWASDRLADDGIIGFITNRAYLDTKQDDGFRRIAVQEFTDIYILDLGSDVRRNPKISGTTHNVFGIQTGVAIVFFVREKTKLGECGIHYARREDAELATNKLAYLRGAALHTIGFDDITPDAKSYWLEQSDSDFEELIALADDDTDAVFDLHAPGVVTARDEWVYDFTPDSLKMKARFFADAYNGFLDKADESYSPVIKWSRNLRRHFQGGRRINFDESKIVTSRFRPFVNKWYFADSVMSNDLTRNHFQMFGSHLGADNRVICIRLDHPARFVAVFVDALDKEGWAELGVEINGDPLGAPAYHPRALLCVWLYGFMTGVRSCRKLEAACRDQIPYLWLTGKPASSKNSCLISLPAARCRETAGRRTAGNAIPPALNESPNADTTPNSPDTDERQW